MLQNTDPGDCTLSDLNLPYEALYIHLGLQEAISLPYDATEDEVLTREFVTGAFVATADYDVPGEMRGKRLKFGLTTSNGPGSVNKAPVHYFDVLPSEADLPVNEAIDVAMKRRINTLRKTLNIDDSKAAIWFNGFIEDTAILVKKSMPLIMNSLFSMEAMRDDAKLAAKLSMGNGTPQALVDKWIAAGESSKRQKLESTLFKEGHTVVKILGAGIPSSKELLGHSEHDGPRRSFWRSGHFREQAHGPRMSLRKRILIKPVLVNAHAIDPIDVDGHIYKIGGDIGRSKPRGP